MICQFCKVDDKNVCKVPAGNGRNIIAHESCFIEWAKAVLKHVEEREDPNYWEKFLGEVDEMHKADQALSPNKGETNA